MSSGIPTVSELVERYLPGIAPRSASPRSASVARRHLDGIGRRIAANTGVALDELTLNQLSPAELSAAFRAWAVDLGPVSVRRTWRTWHRFFEALVADGIVGHNPLEHVPGGQEPADRGATGGLAPVSGTLSSVSGLGEPRGLAAAIAAHPARAVLARNGRFVPG